MPRDLLLVRHGESEGNAALALAKAGNASRLHELFQQRPQAEWQLTPKGREQAALAGRFVRRWIADQGIEGFDRYYCSPYVRTRETAALLGLDEAEWQLEPLIRERDFGLGEGRSPQEVEADWPMSVRQKRQNRFLWRPVAGESTPDLDLRLREMLATFARELSMRRVICVTHEDAMLALRFRLEKQTVEEWIDNQEDPAQQIVNCGILHYTRVDPESGSIAPKFGWVRLVDPARDDAEWTPIERRRFTNEELLGQVAKIARRRSKKGIGS